LKFNEYVKRRMEPFAALKPPFGMNYTDMVNPLGKCLVDLAGVKSTAEKATELEWMQSDEGSRVNQVCAEAADSDECPTVATLKAIWKRFFPPLNEQREHCTRCGGSGYIIVEGEYGTSGAYPCSHKPETDADRRMGVRFAPNTARLYAKNLEDAEKRKEAMAAKTPVAVVSERRAAVNKIIQPLTEDVYRGEF
jgi:hypothetical protein